MISIIIPVYNEEKALPATLARVFEQSGDYEIIIADGGSSDRTREIAHYPLGARWLSAPKGRATQMNAGARAAKGEWLLFLHADTLLPANALARIAALNETILAGGFRQRFSGNDWRLRLISFLHNWRCSRTHIFYGDQSMFVRRKLFAELGGFPEVPMLEDLEFCDKLVQVTQPLLLEEEVTTDSRKFVKMGIWRSFARVFIIIVCYQLRLPFTAQKFFSDIRG
ncbi:MAG: TIGR04283 family arsenosugar biosynthesis glycosyltransferase [Burkholderiales bacterium]